MSKIKKIRATIVLVGVVSLSITMFGVHREVKAFDGVGDGSSTYPFRITDCDHLNDMRSNSSAYYVLSNDIDCTGTSAWNAGSGWIPFVFSGNLDGRNYTIDGITINRTGSNVGFFSQLYNASVSNLKFTNLSVTVTGSASSTGGLAGSTGASGQVYPAVISNVQVSGDVSGTQTVGGIAGDVYEGGNISKSSFTGTVTDSSSYGGGFAGRIFDSSVADSFANVTYNGANVGAGFTSTLASYSSTGASITRSYVVGTTNNTNYASSFVSFIGEYSTGQVTVADSFVVADGYNGTNNYMAPFATISAGTPTVTNFFFDQTAATTSDCGASLTCTAVNSDGEDSDHFKSVSNIAPFTSGWDFIDTWQTNVGAYPTLKDASLEALADPVVPGVAEAPVLESYDSNTTMASWASPSSLGGSAITDYVVRYRPHTVGDTESWIVAEPSTTSSGYEHDPLDTFLLIDDIATGQTDFQVAAVNAVGQGDFSDTTVYDVPAPPSPDISSCEDLQAIADEPSGNYSLTQDIDCSDTTAWNDNGDGGYYGFEPIAEFSGSLDGNGYVISGLYINRPDDCSIAPFQDLYEGGSITDVSFNGESVTAYCNGAGVVSSLSGDTVIDNVSVTGEISSSYTAGGIAGSVETDQDISITNSNANVTMSESNDNGQENIGGIIGYVSVYNAAVDLTDDVVQTTIDSSNYSTSVGGLIGYVELYDTSSLNIVGSGSVADMHCAFDCGGLIGQIDGYLEDEVDRPQLNIYTSGSINDISCLENCGGQIGYIYGDGLDTTIDGSGVMKGTTGIQTYGQNAGGLIGYAEDDGQQPTLTISRSFVNSDIFGDFEGYESNDNVGGLVGRTEMTTAIDNSYLQGAAVSYGYYGGGLVGRSSNNLSIDKSYASGEFTGAFLGPAGGLVGGMTDGIITNSFASIMTGVGEEGTPGGAIGQIDGTLDVGSSIYVNVPIVGLPYCYGSQEDDASCHLVNADEESEDYNPDYFLGNSTNPPLNSWNFDSVWDVAEGDYPTLQWGYVAPEDPVDPVEPANPEISTCEQLQSIGDHLSEDFVLTQNIDCSDSINWNDGYGFTPIGLHTGLFTGTFDGNGFTISGLYMNYPDDYNVGLFSYLTDANVHDLNITGSSITGLHSVGGLAGAISTSTVNNISTNVSVSTESYRAGGLTGYANDSDIGQVSASGDVTGVEEGVGGLFGVLVGSSLSQGSASGDVSGTNERVGGLIGDSDSNDVLQSFATGNVESTDNAAYNNSVGGLIGASIHDNIIDTYARGDVFAYNYYVGGLVGSMNTSAISNSYSTGDVSGSFIVGGLVGYNYGPSSFQDSFTVSSVTSVPNEIYISDEAYTNSFIGDDGDGLSTYSNDHYNSDNLVPDSEDRKPCAVDDDYNLIGGEDCNGTSISELPQSFMETSDEPLAQWDFDSIWQANDDDYPTFQFAEAAPSSSPEDNGPNHGDANDDGIADSLQDYVTSYVNPVTGKWAVLAINQSSGCTITTVQSRSESANSTADSGFDYPLGLMNFVLHCATAGVTVDVTQIYYQPSSSLSAGRKYNPNTNAYFAIPAATSTTATIDSMAVVKLSYQVTDGGLLDTDAVPGTITDPAGLAQNVVGSPNTGLSHLGKI